MTGQKAGTLAVPRTQSPDAVSSSEVRVSTGPDHEAGECWDENKCCEKPECSLWLRQPPVCLRMSALKYETAVSYPGLKWHELSRTRFVD